MVFAGRCLHHQWPRRSRRALRITDAELRLIANAAIRGDRSHPVNGYSTPAAIGTREQAQTLSTLRDTLLPRLISGQLRLPEAQAASEAALGGTLSV